MNYNRRQWLRTAGLATGALSFFSTSSSATGNSFFEFIESRETLHYPPDTLVRLSSNENPYGPSDKVRKAMSDAFDSVCRYPWQERRSLREKIARKENVTPDHILITVGSTEGLKATSLAYALHGGEVIAGDPTFETMLYYAENFGAPINRVPLDENLVLDLDEMEKRINHNTRLIFLCNPNNPTGTIVPAGKLRDFCEAACKRTMVFSDEAYYDYITEPGYPSMVELVKEDRNVIVSRTFSKVYGLAGIRIGYLIARPDIIERIGECQADRPNMLALHAASAAMDETEFYKYSLDMNAQGRQKIYQTLDRLNLPYAPSHTNFVFFKTGRDISTFNRAMQEQGIRVGRPFPPLLEWCRVSTGKLEDMDKLQRALTAVLG